MIKRTLAFVAICLFAGLVFSAPVNAQEPSERGSITIELDANSVDNRNFDFEFDPGADFSLRDNHSVTREGLRNRTYTVRFVEPGYQVVDIDCDGDDESDIHRDLRRGTIEIELNNHEDIECVVEIDVEDEPIPVPTATPVPATPVPTREPTVPCVIGSEVVVLVGTRCPQPVATSTPAPAPITVVQQVPTQIRPPSTGDAGLLGN